jgi:hypothetical protein
MSNGLERRVYRLAQDAARICNCLQQQIRSTRAGQLFSDSILQPNCEQTLGAGRASRCGQQLQDVKES